MPCAGGPDFFQPTAQAQEVIVFIIETLSRLVRQLRNNERGGTTVQYAIMLVLIAIAVVEVLRKL